MTQVVITGSNNDETKVYSIYTEKFFDELLEKYKHLEGTKSYNALEVHKSQMIYLITNIEQTKTEEIG